jgi:hypothetical protein
MPGGLLNLVSYGNQNLILNGNPLKTMFKCTYSKYTNFGLQKFRIDFDGSRSLRMNESSKFDFKISRYADLLMDTYLVVTLPTIWSPILPPKDCSGEWLPYEFKWIENLGTQMIKEVNFVVGGQVIQKFSGQYLYNLVERDFTETKKKIYYNMTGNIAELNDPANSGSRINVYPSAYYEDPLEGYGPEPSIRSRKLYVPLNIWFTLAAKMAFPLVSLQYNEFHIEVELRPVNELFIIRDVTSPSELSYIHPNQNEEKLQFHRFLQPPPKPFEGTGDLIYADKRTSWAADIHLISTYAFLSEDEVKIFASHEQKYLIKEVYEYTYHNVTGSKKVELDSLGMVANWMWYFQRSDIYLRNEWSNYTNWPYNYLPYDLIDPKTAANVYEMPITVSPCPGSSLYNPGTNPSAINPSGYNDTKIWLTGRYHEENQKDIMYKWSLILDGKYRENEFDAGVFNYIEKYVRTSGNSPDGLYCYNFNLQTNPFDFQPSGAMNLSKFNNIEFEFKTYQPPLESNVQVLEICDGEGNIIGINKPTWRIYDYNYDLTVLEERYNVLTFTSGSAALMYAR